MMEAWHFLKSDRRLAYPPHTPVVVGETLTVEPDLLELCSYGLHASVNALDALNYAPGPVVCRVRLGGRILTGDDKVCAAERTVIAMADATDTLHAFARGEALRVAHLWDCPAVVREYLETGREDLRAAAAAESAWSRAAEYAALSAVESAWSAARSARSAAESAWSAESAQNDRLAAMLSRLLGLAS